MSLGDGEGWKTERQGWVGAREGREEERGGVTPCGGKQNRKQDDDDKKNNSEGSAMQGFF